MSHRAEGLNDIFENDVIIRKKVIAESSGTIQNAPVDAKDIVNKEYVDGNKYTDVEAVAAVEAAGYFKDQTDVDHNLITNSHNLTTDIDHDQLTNFTTAEHFTMLDEDDMASDSDTQAATQQSIKAFVEDITGANKTVTAATFDITSNTAVVSATADQKIYVVAISMHNNDSTSTNDTPVKITDGNAGTALYGGATGHVYLVGRGGFFGLPMSVSNAWFECSTNTALYLNPTEGKRVSGVVWYYKE